MGDAVKCIPYVHQNGPDVHVLVQYLLQVIDQTKEGGLPVIGGSEGRKVIIDDHSTVHSGGVHGFRRVLEESSFSFCSTLSRILCVVALSVQG